MAEEQQDGTIRAGFAMGVLAAVLLVGLVVLVLLGAGPLDSPEGELAGAEGAAAGGAIWRGALGQSWLSRTVGRVRTPAQESRHADTWATTRRR